MNNCYVILNINKSGVDIDLMKIDKYLNKFDRIILNLNNKNEILDFINFCKNSVVILSKREETLSFILEILYQNKIYNKFNFKYIDVGDISFNSSIDIYNYLQENNFNNLEILLFTQINHGRIFRGITYSKYLCDIKVNNNKYYGYIVDFSKDKYVSYYSCLKEIKGEYFSKEELKMLEKNGSKIILNVKYLSDQSLSFTNYYFIVDDNDRIDSYIQYKKKNKELKLVLWGNIDKVSKCRNLIDIVKRPWDYWNLDDIR